METHIVQAGPLVRAASSPGGPPPHYRVQYLPPQARAWRLYAVCTSRREAERAAERLRAAGRRARVVAYRYCSTAA